MPMLTEKRSDGTLFFWPPAVLKARRKHDDERRKLGQAGDALAEAMGVITSEKFRMADLDGELRQLDRLLVAFKRQVKPTYEAAAHQHAEEKRAWDETPDWQSAIPPGFRRSPAAG